MRKRWLLMVPVLFFCDRALKIWAHNDLMHRPGSTIELIEGVVRLRYVENTGAAFSLFAGNSLLLIGLTSLIMLAILLYLLLGKRTSGLISWSLMLVLAGGLGNLYDRILFSKVIDYVEPLFVQFAIFNLADVFVCVGALLCGAGLLISDHQRK